MVDVKVYSDGSVQSADVDPSPFGDQVLGRTLKDAVVMYEANVRAGTVKTKTRGEVKGPNKKLWRQKHTGRARMGTKKSPLWRGGGNAFGPRPRDYVRHMPVKARRAALRNAVYTKLRDGEVALASGWPSDQPSTKTAFSILQALGAHQSALVVTAERDATVHMSLRNVPHVDVRPVQDLNAHAVLLRRHLVLTPDALELLKTRLAGGSRSRASASRSASRSASQSASQSASPKED